MRKGMEEFERYYVNTKERVLRDVKKSLVTYSPKIETYYRHSHFFAEEFKRYSTEFVIVLKNLFYLRLYRMNGNFNGI